MGPGAPVKAAHGPPPLRHWLAPLLLFLATLLLWALAYRVPFGTTLHIGGDALLQRRDDDAQFLRGFNDSEPATGDDYRWWLLPPGYAYRWTTSAAAIDLPGVGAGRWVISVLAQSGRPDQPAAVEWQASGMTPLRFSLPPGEARRYYLLADTAGAADLRLTLRSPPYAPPGDARELGIVLRQVRATATGPLMPAPAHLGWLALVLAGAYAVARSAFGGRSGLLFGAICGLAGAYALAYHRLAATAVAPTLPLIVVLSAALYFLVLRLGLRNRQLFALVLLAFVLRLGGMLHPQAMFSDARFNANNLLQIGLGEILLTAGLPAEAGGGSAPYPPGFYLLLLPLQALLPPDIVGRVFVVQLGSAVLDSLVLALIGALLLRAGWGRRAALLGAACYLVPPPLLQSFSIGEYANIGGQALALGFVALLMLGRAQATGTAGLQSHHALLLLSLVVGLLVHSGVTLSLGALVLAACLLAAVGFAGWGENRARRLLFLAGISVAALAIVSVCYYTAPIFIAGLAGRGEGVGAGGNPPWLIVRDTALAVVGLARPQGRAPLPPLLGAVALAGLLLASLGRGQATARLAFAWVLGAWWLGMLLSQGLLLFADQGVRWAIFLYPALCLGAGPCLAALEQRGRAGQFVARTALAATIVYGLATWITQIRDYFHI